MNKRASTLGFTDFAPKPMAEFSGFSVPSIYQAKERKLLSFHVSGGIAAGRFPRLPQLNGLEVDGMAQLDNCPELTSMHLLHPI